MGLGHSLGGEEVPGKYSLWKHHLHPNRPSFPSWEEPEDTQQTCEQKTESSWH